VNDWDEIFKGPHWNLLANGECVIANFKPCRWFWFLLMMPFCGTLVLKSTKMALFNITLTSVLVSLRLYLTFAKHTDSKIANDKQNFLDRNYKELNPYCLIPYSLKLSKCTILWYGYIIYFENGPHLVFKEFSC